MYQFEKKLTRICKMKRLIDILDLKSLLHLTP